MDPPSHLARRGLTGERRPVTILFTDIAGSTSIAERLDPEEYRELVSSAQRRVIDAVSRYEGTLAQLLGDGALAFFGAPIAHEDDPARAVRAALDIQAAIVAFARELAGFVDDFAMRVGIHTGEVVVGELGSAGFAEYTATGDAVNLASRLQAAASPGKILLSESTARLVRQAFELTSLGPISVKGKTAPVSVYEVVRPKTDAVPPRGLLSVHSPLVGREAELAALTTALDALSQGHGSIVALLGEAGVGKSRLVEEARAWAQEGLTAPPRWLEGRALSYGAGIPYWVVTQLLKASLGLSDGDPELRVRVALRRELNRLFGVEAGQFLPYLAHLLGLKPDEGDVALPRIESETFKYQVLVSIRRFFAALATQQSLVLLCDDLHWADPSSLDALHELLAVSDHAPLLLLLVSRVERQHGSWQLKMQAETEYPHRFAEIQLRPLGETDVARLAGNLLDAGDLPENLRRLLLDRAEGNPFYLEELIAHLHERDALEREEGVWRLKRPVETLGIPDTLQAVLLARIDRLETDVRATVQMASVIGRSFLYRILDAVADAEAELDRHLVILQRADLVREKAVRPELEYIFKHSLAQEAAYHSLLLQQRREFHRRVGEALERLFPDRQAELYGLLAHHFDLAGQNERAVHYLLAAGDKARREDALPEAEAFYRRAVERLEVAGDADAAAKTWLKLALVHQADFDFAAAHDAYERGFAWSSAHRQRAPLPPEMPPLASGVLREAGTDEVRDLEPARARGSIEVLLLMQLFAGLAEVDAEWSVVPHAARSWEVLEGGRCYRVHLRPDVRWTDGTLVTADDYAYAWSRNLDPRVAPRMYPASLLTSVIGAHAYREGQRCDPELLGVRALDDLTLEIRLEQPSPYFPYLLALWVTYPLPRRIIDRWGDGWLKPEHFVSNGAYRLLHFEPSHVVLDANPFYFGERNGNVVRFEYLAVRDERELLDRFRNGELDSIGLSPGTVVPDLAEFRHHWPSLMTAGFVLAPHPPLDDVRVRRAIAMAIDRHKLAEEWAARAATGGILPFGMPGHTPGLGLRCDPEGARRLLAEAGYSNGKGFRPLSLLAPTTRVGDRMAQALLEALNIEIVAEVDFVATADARVHPSSADLIAWAWNADLPDPDNFLRHSWLLSILRNAGYQDGALDALVERAARTAPRAERMAMYREADRQLVVEQVALVPLIYRDTEGLRRPWVHGDLEQGHLKDAIVDKHASA